MTDPLDALGARAGAQLRQRTDAIDTDEHGALAGVRRRAARPSGAVTAAAVLLLVFSVVGVAWLVRVDGAGPVDAGRDGRTVLGAGADDGWESVAGDAFRSTEGVGTVRGVEVAEGTVVAVGGDAGNGHDGTVRPSVWRSADGREWERVDADRIDDGGEAFAAAAALMTDVTVVVREGGPRLVAVGHATFLSDRRVPLAWVSDDLGASWALVEPGDVAGRLEAVGASRAGIVAVGSAEAEDGAVGASWVSSDGERWERATPAGLADTDLLISIAAAGERYTATAIVGGEEPALWTSSDGRSWQPARVRDRPAGRLFLSRVTAADDGGFLAVGAVEPPGGTGADGLVLRSGNGRTWRQAADPVGAIPGDGVQRLHDITADDDGLVAVGVDDGDPVVWEARDGRAWEVAARGDGLLAEAGPDATAAMNRLLRVPAGLLAIGSVTEPPEHLDRAVAWLRPAGERTAGRMPPPDPTGLRLVASSDTQLTIADVDAAIAESFDLDELSGGDPAFRLARRGNAIVFYGTGGDTYVVDPDGPEQPRKLGDSTYFLPSADDDRVWLVDGAAGSSAENRLREVTVDGEETVGSRDVPGGAIPTGAVSGGIVLSTAEGLDVWDPAADDVVARLPGGQFVAAGGSLLAWCENPCATLHATAIGSGDTGLPSDVDDRVLEAPEGAGEWVPHRGEFAPDGRHLAVALTAAADPFASPGTDYGLAVIDVTSGDVQVLDEAGVPPGPFAWSPDGRWLFAPTAGGGVLVHDTERDRTDVRALELRTVHGLATVE